MSRIAPIYYNRVRYTLFHESVGTELIREPIGWSDDDNEFIRHKTFHGILPQLTNNLGFTGNGRAFINTVKEQYGVIADIRLTKDEKNPKTDAWERQYSGFLDLLTYEEFNDTVSVKFVSSNLLKVLKSRESEKIELERTTTLSGEEIPALNNELVALNGREIFLKSLLEVDPEDSVSTAFRMNFSDGNTRTGSLGVPTTISFESDDLVNGVFKDSSFTTTPDNATVSSLFYGVNDRDKTLNLSIDLSCNVDEVKIDDLEEAFLYVVLAVFNNGTNYDVKERILLTGNLINNSSVIEPQVNLTYSESFSLLEGESLSLQWYGGGEFGSIIGGDGDLKVDFENTVASISINEDSFFDSTQSDVLLPFETLERYLKILTDQENILLSNVLGRTDTSPVYEEDGEAALIGATHGFKVRGFSPSTAEDNRYKPMTSTFKDWYEAYFHTWNLGMGVEVVGFTEKIRFEKKTYFYNRNTLIHLGKEVDGKFEYIQVNNVKRTVDPTKFNTGIELGYNKGGEYEEAVGLDEPNGISTFSTVIDKGDAKYVRVSKYRADSYGMEFCRRFPFSQTPTEDTKYDSSIWLMDMKRGVTDVFEQRLWQDDFAQIPTGIFSPSTATNLRLSPFNNLLRHGWWVKAGLTKYPEEFVRYGSSTNNSLMTTQLIDGNEYAENGNIANKDLEDARMTGDIIEFDYEVDYDLLQQIKGKTVILGDEIPNFYGLVAFKNEKNEIEKGYLQKLSPNGVGKWTLSKYNNAFAVEESINPYDFQNEDIFTFQNDFDFIFN